MFLRSLIVAIMLTGSLSSTLQAAPKPEVSEALSGLTAARVIVDVRVPDLEKLVFNLRLFEETFEGIEKQGVKADMIVAFRGPGVRLLTVAALDEEALDLFRTLKKKGVRFEACAVAMRVFKADPAKLLPEVKLVPNGFYSLIGYQNKGYATIAVN